MRARSTIALAAILAGGALGVAEPASAAQQAFVRVNQVGYGALAPKRAYLMSNFSETGAPYLVKDETGSTVLTGTVGQPAGSWSQGFPDVYPLDFDGVQAPGRYTLVVGGASSPSFEI